MAVKLATLSAVVTSVALAIGACGPNASPSPDQPGPPPTGNQVTGRERIGWDQAGADASIVRAYTYWVYVDGVRSRLTGVECASSAGAQGLPCSAALPALTPGQHTLELTAGIGEVGVLESPRSAPLVVVMTGSGLSGAATTGDRVATPSDETRRDPPPLVTVEGISLVARRVAEVAHPTALRFAPDGRLFVAEQYGRVRVVVDGQLQDDPALALDDIAVGPTAGLLGLALDPDFDRTRHVYLIYTVQGPEGIEKELVRYREVAGVLAEKAVLLSGIPATLADDSASLDFGPDGKLYVATGTPIDVRRFEGSTISAGQLLRLNPDGTTPADNPAYSPIVLRSLTQPVAVAWIGGAGWRVVIERAASPADGYRRIPGVSASEGRLRLSPAPSAAAYCRNSAIPEFRSDLFVAVPESRGLLRVRVDSRDGHGSVGRESLLDGRLGPVAVVACGPDGDLYVGTRHSATGEEGPDRLFRLQPAER